MYAIRMNRWPRKFAVAARLMLFPVMFLVWVALFVTARLTSSDD